ncbi:sigma-54-dependent Fis family transcriptional regulator [uncultured Deefgea sp.]|uniref:sigma-54-dependent Fis family transcriptional regulator n=1 Tax=uncultured Deefgea sp. TaxID=1304914 RepID=UPI00263348C0|nr:sigma-54-dependent Fis family transcriptional regulator [uncultured Deefgea sp.]
MDQFQLQSTQLLAAHQRSAQYGLDAVQQADYVILSAKQLQAQQDEQRGFYLQALPVLSTLYQQIAKSHSTIVLTDANGLVLHALGDDQFLAKNHKVALKPGAIWSEQYQGTNAIGTALAEQHAITVHAEQHFLRANQGLTCASVPIFSPDSSLLGVIDVTGDYRSYHASTLSLIKMSAQELENKILDHAFHDALYISFHSRAELIATAIEGILVFDLDGQCLAANQSALFQLGAAAATSFAHCFDTRHQSINDIFSACRFSPAQLTLTLHNGMRIAAIARFASAPKTQQSKRFSHLNYLNTGDAQVARIIERVSKVLGHEIPILITGETGSGKELLAQAIHKDSPQASKNFVAINCASIPESLIESELFGYAEGAFTGAKRSGNHGKIIQAQGGTLFLDEIGDMPLALQARLLRVLQEREITPLGSDRSIAIDMALICATHRDLAAQVAQGWFREDLYYRIQGLTVKLPPVRERSDLAVVIGKILHNLGQKQLSPAALARCLNYDWPGNFRQLYMVLRTAAALAGDEKQLDIAHFPDEFIDATTVNPEQASHLHTLSTQAIQTALAAHHGNISATARALGISRNTVYRNK